MIRVALVDDHPVVLGGLEMGLRTIDDIAVVATARTLEEARTVARRDDVDVMLLDLRLPDGNGLELLPEIAARGRPAAVVLSSFELRQYVAAALRFGANGFVSKTAPLEEVAEVIRVVASGGSAFTADQLRQATSGYVSLSGRERQVVRLLMDGLTNDEIATTLGVASKTVEGYLSRMFVRTGVTTRVELAMRASREGWLDVDSGAAGR